MSFDNPEEHVCKCRPINNSGWMEELPHMSAYRCNECGGIVPHEWVVDIAYKKWLRMNGYEL